MPPQDAESQRWFVEQLAPHEPMLRAWLHNRFPAAKDIDDVVQEAFMRVLQARVASEIASPKAFLFATARNIVLGGFRHQKTVDKNVLTEIEALGILDEDADVPDAVARAQELDILTHAIQSLPPRCRQILTLRKIYGVSQRDIAEQLGISEHTVEAQGAIGLRKIAEYFERFERDGTPGHD